MQAKCGDVLCARVVVCYLIFNYILQLLLYKCIILNTYVYSLKHTFLYLMQKYI